jgi:hypothetical protein
VVKTRSFDALTLSLSSLTTVEVVKASRSHDPVVAAQFVHRALGVSG